MYFSRDEIADFPLNELLNVKHEKLGQALCREFKKVGPFVHTDCEKSHSILDSFYTKL